MAMFTVDWITTIRLDEAKSLGLNSRRIVTSGEVGDLKVGRRIMGIRLGETWYFLKCSLEYKAILQMLAEPFVSVLYLKPMTEVFDGIFSPIESIKYGRGEWQLQNLHVMMRFINGMINEYHESCQGPYLDEILAKIKETGLSPSEESNSPKDDLEKSDKNAARTLEVGPSKNFIVKDLPKESTSSSYVASENLLESRNFNGFDLLNDGANVKRILFPGTGPEFHPIPGTMCAPKTQRGQENKLDSVVPQIQDGPVERESMANRKTTTRRNDDFKKFADRMSDADVDRAPESAIKLDGQEKVGEKPKHEATMTNHTVFKDPRRYKK